MKLLAVLCIGLACALVSTDEGRENKVKVVAPKKFYIPKVKSSINGEVPTNEENQESDSNLEGTVTRLEEKLAAGNPEDELSTFDEDKSKRKKKSATTTFCVEIRPNSPYQKPFQVCEPEYKSYSAPAYHHISKPSYSSPHSYAPAYTASYSSGASHGGKVYSVPAHTYSAPKPSASYVAPATHKAYAAPAPSYSAASGQSSASAYGGSDSHSPSYRSIDNLQDPTETTQEATEEEQHEESTNLRSAGYDDYGSDYGGSYGAHSYGGYGGHGYVPVTYITHVPTKKYKFMKKGKDEHGHNGLVITCQPSLAGYASTVPAYGGGHGSGYGGGYGYGRSSYSSYKPSYGYSSSYGGSSYSPPASYGNHYSYQTPKASSSGYSYSSTPPKYGHPSYGLHSSYGSSYSLPKSYSYGYSAPPSYGHSYKKPEKSYGSYSKPSYEQSSYKPSYGAPSYKTYESPSYHSAAAYGGSSYKAPTPSYGSYKGYAASPSYSESYSKPSYHKAPVYGYSPPTYSSPSYGYSAPKGYGYKSTYNAPAYSYSAPAYSAPSYSKPSYSAPSYSASSYSPPAYSAPAYSKPTYSPPSYSAPSYPKPSYPAPSYSVPSYSPPAYSAPSYSAPSYSAPSYSAPSYPKPSYSAPSYSSPAYSAPSYSAPSYPKPSYSAPSYSAPSYPSSSYSPPSYSYSAPSYSPPAYSLPAYSAPSYSAPYSPPHYNAPGPYRSAEEKNESIEKSSEERKDFRESTTVTPGFTVTEKQIQKHTNQHMTEVSNQLSPIKTLAATETGIAKIPSTGKKDSPRITDSDTIRGKTTNISNNKSTFSNAERHPDKPQEHREVPANKKDQKQEVVGVPLEEVVGITKGGSDSWNPDMNSRASNNENKNKKTSQHAIANNGWSQEMSVRNNPSETSLSTSSPGWTPDMSARTVDNMVGALLDESKGWNENSLKGGGWNKNARAALFSEQPAENPEQGTNAGLSGGWSSSHTARAGDTLDESKGWNESNLKSGGWNKNARAAPFNKEALENPAQNTNAGLSRGWSSGHIARAKEESPSKDNPKITSNMGWNTGWQARIPEQIQGTESMIMPSAGWQGEMVAQEQQMENFLEPQDAGPITGWPQNMEGRDAEDDPQFGFLDQPMLGFASEGSWDSK